MTLAAAESIPPFALITLACMAMGALQGLVHKAFNGKPKPTGVDEFDRALSQRDARLGARPDIFAVLDKVRFLASVITLQLLVQRLTGFFGKSKPTLAWGLWPEPLFPPLAS
jgi:NADH-ubiquinone oxidoreductase MWFE subunit